MEVKVGIADLVPPKVKAHLEKHKTKYILGGGILIGVFASFTWSKMRGQTMLGGRSWRPKSGADVVGDQPTSIVGSFFSGDGNSVGNTTNNTTNNYGVTPLSYIVREDGTDNWWLSQALLSLESGISESDISKHLNHKKELASGRSFSRVGVRSA